jgi:uncharacterized protein (TIGR01777 family)
VTIVIAGGSGFLGRKLAKRLEADGGTVVTLTRRTTVSGNEVHWAADGIAGALSPHLEGVDAVVNLAGEGVADRRWTAARKEAIRRSRMLATRTLVRAIAACAQPPRVLVSASGVGYYGARGDEPIGESAPPGNDFLARVSVEWEQQARVAESPRTRVAVIRTGIVLDKDGGALARMLPPFKLGLGATLGSGDQYMPWIHIDDWAAMAAWLIRDDRADGPFNAAAPEPVTNRTFTRTLGRVLRRPAILHAPAFVLHAALGELSSVLLTGQRALPVSAEQLGFRFSHRTLEPALRSLNL